MLILLKLRITEKKAAAHDKQTQAEQARKYQEKPQRRQPTKPAVYSEKNNLQAINPRQVRPEEKNLLIVKN